MNLRHPIAMSTVADSNRFNSVQIVENWNIWRCFFVWFFVVVVVVVLVVDLVIVLLVAVDWSLEHPNNRQSVSLRRICLGNCSCCHTRTEAVDQTRHAQNSDTAPTSPGIDHITPVSICQVSLKMTS